MFLDVQSWFKDFLRRWAKNDPEDFLKYLERLPLTKMQRTVMKKIYLSPDEHNRMIKIIADDLCMSERNVKYLHSAVIKIALDRVETIKPKA